jgi:hypothetical protein
MNRTIAYLNSRPHISIVARASTHRRRTPFQPFNDHGTRQQFRLLTVAIHNSSGLLNLPGINGDDPLIALDPNADGVSYAPVVHRLCRTHIGSRRNALRQHNEARKVESVSYYNMRRAVGSRRTVSDTVAQKPVLRSVKALIKARESSASLNGFLRTSYSRF